MVGYLLTIATGFLYPEGVFRPPVDNLRTPEGNFRLPEASFRPPVGPFRPPVDAFRRWKLLTLFVTFSNLKRASITSLRILI